MPDIQWPSCSASVLGTAKFCPECGVRIEPATRKRSGKKGTKKKVKKQRSGIKALMLRFFEIIGRAIVNALDWLLIVALMPMISVWLPRRFSAWRGVW